MRVCGVDPGLERTGYAVLEGTGQRPTVVDAGVITTSRNMALPARLVEIADAWAGVLDEHAPTTVAVEQLFAHYKHPRTAIQMGHARGVILETAARRGVELIHLAATEVKRATTGNGRAPKAQMQRAIQVTLGLASLPEPADVADALAIALCALERAGAPEFNTAHGTNPFTR